MTTQTVRSRLKKLKILIYAFLWCVSTGVIVFFVFFRPNIYPFFIWNAAIKEDYPAIKEYAFYLNQASTYIYKREGVYYSLLSDVLGQIHKTISENIQDKTEGKWAGIRNQLIEEIENTEERFFYDTQYIRRLYELLAWVYFNEKNYDLASQYYLRILIKNEKDENIRHNYEVSLLLKKLLASTEDTDKAKSTVNEDEISPEVLSLFKIKKSDAYRVFESPENDTQLPNY